MTEEAGMEEVVQRQGKRVRVVRVVGATRWAASAVMTGLDLLPIGAGR